MLFPQLFRYGCVGIISNSICYIIYLALSAGGLGHKLSMTLVYVIGIGQTFYLNKKWTFIHDGKSKKTFARYCFAYTVGYLINFCIVLFLVDQAGFPHQIIQAMAIFIVALALFLLQKFWIFR